MKTAIKIYGGLGRGIYSLDKMCRIFTTAKLTFKRHLLNTNQMLIWGGSILADEELKLQLKCQILLLAKKYYVTICKRIKILLFI